MNISLFILEYIFFEIILCNAEKVDSQNINDNFKKLESKKCLIKENEKWEGLIEKLQEIFYKLFAVDKKKIQLEINIYKNQFPLFNTILYKVELNFNNNFYFFVFICIYWR